MMAPIAAFGILAVAAAVQAASGLRFALIAVPPLAVAADARTAVVGGFVGPLLVVGVNGRPTVDVLRGLGLRPRELPAALAAVFSAADAFGVPAFAVTGQIILRPTVGISRLAVPAVAPARWAGNVPLTRLDSVRFRRNVRGALVVSSGATAMRATSG